MKNAISDHAFFSLIGFDEVRSVDLSDYEGADYVFDMNQPGLGELIGSEFDLVFDGGTIQHIFDVRNIFSVTRTGGHVIHHVLTNNYVDHGFYQFSPVLFFEYYHANRFVVHELSIVGHTDRQDEWWTRRYAVDGRKVDANDELKGDRYATFAFCTKQPDSTWEAVPNQSTFVDGHDRAVARSGDGPIG